MYTSSTFAVIGKSLDYNNYKISYCIQRYRTIPLVTFPIMIVPPLMSEDIVPHMGCCITISPTPCADPTLNIRNLCQVMASVTEWFHLGCIRLGGLNVPFAVCIAIHDNPAYKTDEEKVEALLLYYLHTIPLASWQHVAGALHFRGEAKALQAAVVFLKYTPAGQWFMIWCII